ncbi:MAG: DUF11 domain-containing protein, partial [Bacteroidetes bacterium]|nr:DUF11 domain-containing protein [Bacteroidota bacterium]
MREAFLLSIINFFLVINSLTCFAQLDTIHYMPPFKPTEFSNVTIVESEVVLSTPSATPISVVITTGNGTPIAGSPFTLSYGSPRVIDLGGNPNSIVLDNSQAGVVLANKGLIMTSNDKFIATFKGRSNFQADMFTAKGRTGMGKAFRWCGFPVYERTSHNAYMGLMAIEDGTTVTVSEYNPACVFRLGGNTSGITS